MLEMFLLKNSVFKEKHSKISQKLCEDSSIRDTIKNEHSLHFLDSQTRTLTGAKHRVYGKCIKH